MAIAHPDVLDLCVTFRLYDVSLIDCEHTIIVYRLTYPMCVVRYALEHIYANQNRFS